MSICVAVGNKVMDTRLPQPAGCGDKYDVSGLGSGLLRVARNDAERNNIAFKGLDVVRQYASKFFKTAESGVDKVVSSCEKNPSVHWMYMNFLRQRKTALDAPLYEVSAGRSMIEMLGVLAIIAVLSVGGIAGYSKAMEQFKINKTIDEYAYLIFGMMEHLDDIKKLDNGTHLLGFLKAIDLFPASWNYSGIHYEDSLGNIVQMHVRSNRLVIDMFLRDLHNSGNEKMPPRLCEKLIQNIALPLHSSLYYVFIYNESRTLYFGDNYCDGANRKCFNQISLPDIHKACSSCPDGQSCAIVLEF